jgi:membrane protein
MAAGGGRFRRRAMRVRSIASTLWTALKNAIRFFREDDPSALGAALAYYTLFSIAPLLVLVVAIAGAFFGADVVRGQLSGQIQGLIGAEGAEQIETMMQGVWRPGRGGVAAAISGVVLIITATAVFGQIRSSLNKLWDVKAKPKRGYLKHLLDRVLSFAMVIVLAFLLLVSLVVQAALTGAAQRFLPQGEAVVLQIGEFIVSAGVTVLLFAVVYKYLSDARLRWRDVWAGAIATAILFVVGKNLIGLYLGRKNVADVYGVAGSIVLLLLWVYYSSQIVFFGAAFTRAFAEARGGKIVPSEQAVRTETREVEGPRGAGAPQPG